MVKSEREDHSHGGSGSPARRPDAPPGRRNGDDATDTPVVDLRDGSPVWQVVDSAEWNPAEGWVASAHRPEAGSDPTAGPASAPPADAAGGPAAPEAPSTTVPPTPEPPVADDHPGRLTRRLVPLLALPLVVVVVAAVASLGLASRSDDGEGDGDRSRAAAALSAQREVRATLDRLWSGVTGLVASAVGPEIATTASVQTLVGEARAADQLPTADDPAAPAAQTARAAFADAVEQRVDNAAGDPFELGAGLEDLQTLHSDAVSAHDTLVGSLEARASAPSDATSRGVTASWVVLALGGLLALAALALVARRVHTGVDLPVARLRAAVRRIALGEEGARARSGGLPELAALGHEFDSVVGGLTHELYGLRSRLEWAERSQMIFDAMELTDDEPALFDVVSRALGVVDPGRPIELLVADRGPNRLAVVASNPHLPAPGGSVDSAAACPALRRGQVAVFDSATSINACLMVRQRAGTSISGACIPVTVAGRPVGVLHATGPEGSPPPRHVLERLEALSSQLGNRLGALRTLESTRQEASTDGLTGLPNRRSLEADVERLLASGAPFVMVLADLDKFKRLNDSYGHEIGDRALQLFAGVLRDNVRGNDVVARLGGEEFVLVYPNMSVDISIEAIGRLRAALARAVEASPLPPFTCSFGIAHSSVAQDGDAILRVADAGLLRAKELGGDQAVFADAELAASVFDDDAARARGDRAQQDRR